MHFSVGLGKTISKYEETSIKALSICSEFIIYLVPFGIIVHRIFYGDGDAAKHDNNKHEVVKMS